MSLAEQAQAAGEAVVKAYPTLDSDPESLELVMHTRNLYIAKGMRPAEAIIKAAEKIMGKAPKAAGESAGTRESREEREQRRFNDKRESLRRHRQIPPTTHRSGGSNRSMTDGLDVGKLSDKKFDNLDAQTKREARGDFVGEKSKPRLRKR